jgi:D-threonate/D-erythronate kinase
VAGQPGNVECILIADDLTGACDAGVHFARCGLKCRVELNLSAVNFSEAGGVLAFNTNSRSDSGEQSRKKIEELAARCSGLEASVIFKKIDSTLRGNVGKEIAAALHAFHCEAAIIAPAFPAMRRIVHNGNLHWADYSGCGEIDILAALSEQGISASKLAVMGLAIEDFERDFNAHLQAGRQLFVVDCISQHDLHFWVAASAAASRRILWVGSAGLGIALAERMAKSGVRRFVSNLNDAPMLFLIGSTHPGSVLQKEALLMASGAVQVVPSKQDIATAQRALKDKRHLVITVEYGMSELDLREFLSGLAGFDVAALFFTGGETGTLLCNAVGAEAIDLCDEILPGIPWGILQGGMFHGLPVASKSGSFGGEDALVRCVDFFAPARRSAK